MLQSPALKLVPPKPSDPMPKVLDTTLSLTDYVSPGHWVLWAIDKICGVNPAEWLGSQIGGDWESISKISSSLDHVGEFYRSYAANLREGSAGMLRGWEGNAAAACGAYFHDFAESVEGQVSALDAVSGECKSVAFGAWASSKAAVSALEALLDIALMIAIEAAATAAVSWTVVGASVGLAVIAAEIGEGIVKWLEILGYVGMTVTAVMGLLGLISGSLGALHGLEAQKLPGRSYDNKVVH